MSHARPLLSVYVSGHGFGHSTRTATFLERLLRSVDCDLDVCSAVSLDAWPAAVTRHVRSLRALPCDVGVLQSTELHVDLAGTGDALVAWDGTYPQRLAHEARRLSAVGTNAVLGDVPPLAFDAAAEAEVPSFALANFSWDWIYGRLQLGEAAAHAARAYGRAGLLLELSPAAPMPAFRSRLSVGLLGRSVAARREAVRASLGLSSQQRLVLVAFRDASSCLLPPPTPGVRYACCDGSTLKRIDRVEVPEHLAFLELLAAADVVVAKTGYGIIADAAATGTPLLYTTRIGFPEDPVLASWLEARPAARYVSRERLRSGEWLADAQEMLCSKRPEPVESSAVERGVQALRAALSS